MCHQLHGPCCLPSQAHQAHITPMRRAGVSAATCWATKNTLQNHGSDLFYSTAHP